MKKKNFIVVVYTILVFALIMSLYNVFYYSKTKLGVLYKFSYDTIEGNLDTIKENMDKIAVSDDNSAWSSLKEINTTDKKLKETYDSLVEDISKCYLLSADVKNNTYDNLNVLDFKDKRAITDKQLIKLGKNETCLKDFDKYNSMTLSDSEETSNRLKKQIDIIIDYDASDFEDKTFIGMLNEETTTTREIASLTNWLEVEYNSNKND